MISIAQLCKIMPNLRTLRASELLPYLNAAMDEWQISNKSRIAAFLAQLAHESCELRVWEEVASGKAYEGRMDLGNVKPGDGEKFKGRGPIQLTGRANYRLAGQALNIDLEREPHLVLRPDVGFRVAGWFWQSHGLNELADDGHFRAITRRINGGINGLEHRSWLWKRAKKVLGE